MESIDHIAIQVSDIKQASSYYLDTFDCNLIYQDDSWALIKFANINLALVLPTEHPPHIAITDEDLVGNDILHHRDGSKSLYQHDPFGNVIERIKY